MSNASGSKLPVGAKFVHREPLTEKSLELAEQLARRGASESLIRAIGGEEAVTRLIEDDLGLAGGRHKHLGHA